MAQARPRCCTWRSVCSPRPRVRSRCWAASRPAGEQQLARVGFVAQDAPLYSRMSVGDHFDDGSRLNPNWDDRLPRELVERLDLDLRQRAGSLSGGQRGQLAFALAVGKRPDLLVLDEPVASLDPLARREFMASLMGLAANGLSVVLSSHLLSDIERVCDYLIVLAHGEVRLAGDVDQLLAEHRVLSGPRSRSRSTPRRSGSHPGIVTPNDNRRSSYEPPAQCSTRPGQWPTSGSKSSYWPTWSRSRTPARQLRSVKSTR